MFVRQAQDSSNLATEFAVSAIEEMLEILRILKKISQRKKKPFGIAGN